MEHHYHFRPAIEADTTRIWEIIGQAKAQMYREEKQQWNESYPALENITSDIQKGYAYVFCEADTIIAYAAVVFDGEPAYNNIKGAWLSNHPYVVVHRLAVADEVKHRGIATLFMHEVEQLSLTKNIHSFKIDTNFDNTRMIRVLEKCGFIYCGEIAYQRGYRLAYEKNF